MLDCVVEIQEIKNIVAVDEEAQIVDIIEQPKTEVIVLEGIYILGGYAGSEFSEIRLTPKVSSSGLEGTMFYCSEDDHVWVATE